MILERFPVCAVASAQSTHMSLVCTLKSDLKSEQTSLNTSFGEAINFLVAMHFLLWHEARTAMWRFEWKSHVIQNLTGDNKEQPTTQHHTRWADEALEATRAVGGK
jgi:hypothetical protein